MQSGQAERRVSARIQEKQREEKLRLVKRRVELLDDTEGGSDGKKKQNNISSRKRRKEEDSENVEEGEKVPVQTTKCESESVNGNAVNLADKSDHAVKLAEKSDHAKVKETLRLFNKHYLHFVQVGFTISNTIYNFVLFGLDLVLVLTRFAYGFRWRKQDAEKKKWIRKLPKSQNPRLA